MLTANLDAIESGEAAAPLVQVVFLAAGYLKLFCDFFLDQEKCQAMSQGSQGVLRHIVAAGCTKSITFDARELAKVCGYERLTDEETRVLQISQGPSRTKRHSRSPACPFSG